MMVNIRKKGGLKPSDVTEEHLYRDRREFMRLGSSAAVAGWASPLMAALAYQKDEGNALVPTAYERITSYNNFYEYGLGKDDPKKKAQGLKTEPWTLRIGGEVNTPMTVDVADLLRSAPLEERIYRFRCVEGWSMVVPWVGFELSYLLKKAGLTSKAKFVEFETLYDPEEFPEQKNPGFFGNIPFPYREGLRIDEAMHPLTILAVGLYGKVLPNQNGAPIRLVVPWKYGFKSIKSIVKITLQEEQARSTWHEVTPHEYGFYANVNPNVPHPRWSQKRERVLGKFFKRDTELFNGYAKEVASLYKGMDLKKYF
jgi:sulfoxide reductase catalytic subunit YedY